MIERLKKQTLKRLLIMLINFIRMAFLNAVHMGNVNASLVQNINPRTEIAEIRNGTKTNLTTIIPKKIFKARPPSAIEK